MGRLNEPKLMTEAYVWESRAGTPAPSEAGERHEDIKDAEISLELRREQGNVLLPPPAREENAEGSLDLVVHGAEYDQITQKKGSYWQNCPDLGNPWFFMYMQSQWYKAHWNHFHRKWKWPAGTRRPANQLVRHVFLYYLYIIGSCLWLSLHARWVLPSGDVT